jgi:integrase
MAEMRSEFGLIPAPRPRFAEILAARRHRPPRMTVAQFVTIYATTRDVEVETVRQYRIVAELFDRWAGGPIHLDELDELVVSAWLRDYAASGVKPATVRSKRNSVLALWRAAADEYFCDPPTRRVRTSRVPWTPPEAWTLAEVRRLVAATGQLRGRHPCGLRRSEWFDLAIRVAWDTGLRWGDLVALRVDDIRGDTVIVAQRKTRRPHCGRIRASTRAVLDTSLESCPREVVCPWPSSGETFRAQVRRLVDKAGIRPGTWKWLRRGGASDVELQAPGRGFAAKHLGHAPGSRIAEVHYIAPAIVAAGLEQLAPRDLDG